MKKAYLILPVLVTIFLFSSCDNNKIDPIPDSDSDTIFAPRLNLSDSKAVFFTSAYKSDNFFKITNNNTIKKVGFINTDGVQIYENPTDNVYISLNWCLNGPDFLILQADTKSWWNESSTVSVKKIFAFINKGTGEILLIDEIYTSLSSSAHPFLKEFNIQSSIDNWFYYMNNSFDVYKVNFSLNYEQYSPIGKEIRYFKVNNMAYMMYRDENYEHVIKSPSGSLFSVSDNVSGDINAFWLGTDNKFYIYRNNESIDRIDITSSDIVITNVYYNYNLNRQLQNGSYFKLEIGNVIYFFPKYLHYNTIWSYDESAKDATDVTAFFPNYATLVDVDSSTDYFYLATKDNIYKYSNNLDGTALFGQNDFDIYAMAVNEQDEIVFNALRNSDGKLVIGIVDKDGNITIIDDTLNKEVEYLEFL